tara:strand:+ start:4708 stop:7215 length:2508 start_codon:yes stop_codon:yes gene_type:complete
MAIDKCIQSVRDAMPDLDEKQAEELLAEVVDIVDTIKSNKAEQKVTDLQRAVDEAIQNRVTDAVREAAILKRNAAINFRVRLAFITKLNATPIEEVPVMLNAIMAGRLGKSQYKQSIESTSRGLASMAMSVFMRTVEANGVPRSVAIGFLQRAKSGESLVKEMDRMATADAESPLKGSGDPTAEAVAKAMEATNEFLRKQGNRSGADIGRIIGRIAKQSHDKTRIAKAGFDTWYNDISPLLDEGLTFGRKMSDGEKRAFLKSTWEHIVLGKRTDMMADLDAAPGFTGPANMGKKLSRARSLHFKKDGKSAWTYMQAYGDRHIGTAFSNQLVGMSDSVAAMMHLGPNPKHMLLGKDGFLTLAKNRAIDEGNVAVINELEDPNYLSSLNFMYDEVTGQGNALPGYGQSGYYIARIANWAKNLTSSALLGGTTLASIGDIGTASIRLNEIGIPFFEANASVLSGLMRGRGSGEIREVADSLGVGLDSLMAGIQSRWLGNDAINGQGAHFVSGLMRITGMNWMNDSLKTAVGISLSNFIAKQAGKKFADIDVSLRSEMEAYGLTPEDFDLMNSAMREVDGVKFHDISAIDDVDAQIRINGFFTGFANSAILTPGAQANVASRGMHRRGTAIGELRNLFMHLKSFSVTYGMEILSRGFSKTNEGHRTGMLVKILMTSMVYGYIASTLKDLAKGKEPINVAENPGKVFYRSLMQAGGLGFYGDTLMGMVAGDARFGEGVAEIAGGPVIGNLSRAAKIPKMLFDEDFDKAGQTGYRIAKSMLPGANIFYARMALDYLLFWNMSEYLNPGWARNYEQRIKDETGQEFMDLGIPPFRPPTEAVR